MINKSNRSIFHRADFLASLEGFLGCLKIIFEVANRKSKESSLLIRASNFRIIFKIIRTFIHVHREINYP